MTARPQVELPELRGAFHAFVKSQGGSVVQREGEYIESMTRLWWTCWRAAIAESEARAEGDAMRLEKIMRDMRSVDLHQLTGTLTPTIAQFRAAIDAAIAQEAEREAGSA